MNLSHAPPTLSIVGIAPPITSYPYKIILSRSTDDRKKDSGRQNKPPEARDCQGPTLSIEKEMEKSSEHKIHTNIPIYSAHSPSHMDPPNQNFKIPK